MLSASLPASTGILVPDSTTESPSVRASRVTRPKPSLGGGSAVAHVATCSPVRRPASGPGLVLLTTPSSQGGRDHVGGAERPRGGVQAEFVGHQNQVEDPVPADAAAAGVFGYHEGRPAQLGSPAPEVGLIAGLGTGQVPDLGQWAVRSQEASGGLLEQFLIGGAFEHPGPDSSPGGDEPRVVDCYGGG